jgi:hypothetical protein
MTPSEYDLYQLECADRIDAGIEADAIAHGQHSLAAQVRATRRARRQQMAGMREVRNARPQTWARRQDDDSGDELRRMRLRLLELTTRGG